MRVDIDRLHPGEHLTAEQRQAIGDDLVEMVRSGSGRPRHRRIAVAVAVGAIVVAGGGTAAAVLGGSQPVTNQTLARCYSEISTDFGDDFPGTTVGAPKEVDNGQIGPVAPIDQCAQAWKVGLLGGHATEPTPRTYPVPHLVGCVLPDGTAAVFPGPDTTCSSLNLPSAQSSE